MKVEEIEAVEPSILMESCWETIVVSEVKPITDSRYDRRRQNQIRQNASQREEWVRINFWDLIMSMPAHDDIILSSNATQSQTMKTVAKEYLPKAFDEMEINRLIDAIRLFLQKNHEM